MTEDALNGGSSPLTRGKHHRPPARRAPGGLIPAHAGKTATACTSATTCGAHPRLRGENNLKMLETDFGSGSSPLTRGKRSASRGHPLAERLIPAHAGKTRSDPDVAPPVGAHPRSRGENTRSNGNMEVAVGSSPLTRGKLGLVGGGGFVSGLIPAHAGKTGVRISGPGCSGAHPRSRGENIETFGGASSLSGSSPLTRGKLLDRFEHELIGRLIPAHAGKTAAMPCS